jgi:hypothetical protein
MAFVVLGLLVRVVRYLLNFPLWCDESMLAANFLDRGYLDLLRPLDYRQVAPVLFLAAELSAVKLLGFSELALRLFPCLCGVASVPLFWHVARRLLSGVPLLLAVGLFAVSLWPVRFASEVKPYASDLLAALALMALAVEWRRQPQRMGWLWALAATAPFAVGLSFPSLLMAGGIGLALLPIVWRSGRRDVWLGYALYGLATLATFALLIGFYKTAPQDHAYFHRDWAGAFPPFTNPLKLLTWFISIHTGYMFAYPDGGQNGLSTLTFVLFVIAAIVLWKRGRRAVLGLCLAPFAVAFVAAALHRYPYGFSPRTMQYVAPTICLFTGLGAAAMLAKVGKASARRHWLRGALAALAVCALARMGWELVQPYRFESDERERAFAKWFWTEKSLHAELACLKQDFGLEFQPGHWGRAQTDMYLCYQKIYSPRHRQRRKVTISAVSHSHPLRCVLFNEFPQQTPAFQAWMASMLERYDLRGFEQFPITAVERKKGLTWDSVYLVYEFVPKPAAAPAAVAFAAGGAAPRR